MSDGADIPETGASWVPTWDGPAIGLLDLDAFFASVEQLDHPSWRGKPVIVGGSAEKRGVVSTASYEARTYGVHSAMPAAEARRLAPDAIWTQGHFDRYREMSDRVMEIIGRETPLVEQVSIDEAFFDVTPGRYSKESPVDICRRIQSGVAALGVTCSIGMGVNKTVAKIASERDKPRGLTVVMPGCEVDFLSPLPVRQMSGIGPASERRLHAMGIKTLGQLARADGTALERSFGVMGARMRERASGSERSVVTAAAMPNAAKSVSNERTFATDLKERDEIEAAIDHISSLVGRRLRKKGLRGSLVTLKVRYDFEHSRTIQRPLPHPTDDEGDFSPIARDLLDSIWHEGMPVRLVGIGISDFDEDETFEEQSFFDLDEVDVRSSRRVLDVTTDEIRERFGDEALSYGRDLRFKGRTSDTQPMHKEDL